MTTKRRSLGRSMRGGGVDDSEEVNGAALIDALRDRKRPRGFNELVKHYRTRGFTDADLVRAMAKSRALINPLRIIR
jgi:hypothetical protein